MRPMFKAPATKAPMLTKLWPLKSTPKKNTAIKPKPSKSLGRRGLWCSCCYSSARWALLLVLMSRWVGADELTPFSSDGCSLFPDANIITQKNWCRCCFAHDVAYWRGGTEADRLQADQKLKACVLKVTGDDWLASAMHRGVRLGGSPYFSTGYRWGYGWPFKRKYQVLSNKEKADSDKLLDAFLKEPENSICH